MLGGLAHTAVLMLGMWSSTYFLLSGIEPCKKRFKEVGERLFNHSDFKEVKWGATLLFLIIPWLTTAIVCSLVVTSKGSGQLATHTQRSRLAVLAPRWLPRIDRSGQRRVQYRTVWLPLAIILPAIFFLLFRVQHIFEKMREKEEEDSERSWIGFAAKLGNCAAYVSVVATAYFMIPVARFSPILEALGVGNAEAVQSHIWAGYLALAGIALHGITTLAKWIVNEIPE